MDGLRPAGHPHSTRAYNSILLERPLTKGEMRANVYRGALATVEPYTRAACQPRAAAACSAVCVRQQKGRDIFSPFSVGVYSVQQYDLSTYRRESKLLAPWGELL